VKRVWALVAMLGVCAGAQQPASVPASPASAPVSAPVEGQLPNAGTIHVESRFVNVALNVTDAQGAPVSGLTANDFQVYEDGKPVKIAVFEKEAVSPLEIVVAVDASESTGAEAKLERDAAKKFVSDLLRPQDRVDLMSFSNDVTEIVPFTSDAHEFDSGFGRIVRGQSTAVYDAVYLAAQRLAEQPASNGARRVIVMITDGENTSKHGTYPAAVEEAERAGAMVYSLIVIPVEADAGRDTGGEHALIQMSRDTGGKFYEIYEKRDVLLAFDHLSDDLRTQYTLGYYAPQKALGGGGLRKIEVRLKDPAKAAKWTLRYRTAYYAR
jgi:Ca-activated chloride channel family protein